MIPSMKLNFPLEFEIKQSQIMKFRIQRSPAETIFNSQSRQKMNPINLLWIYNLKSVYFQIIFIFSPMFKF